MLDMIEKLINEHGSSTILKERLELFNDKYEALESKLKNAEKENQLLLKENEQLKSEVASLKEEIGESNAKSSQLPDIQINILKLLFNESDWVREPNLINHMQLEEGLAKYHLTELIEKGLLKRPLRSGSNPMVSSRGNTEHAISDQGRKYVVEVLNT